MLDFSTEEKSILQDLRSGRWAAVEQKAFAIEDESSLSLLRTDALKVAKYWQRRTDVLVYKNNHSGTELFSEWEDFVSFCKTAEITQQSVFTSVKNFVLKKVIDFLTRTSKEVNNTDREILVQLSYAFYELEMPQQAMETLEFILSKFLDVDDFRVYALIADVYAEVYPHGDPKHDLVAVMFSELFLKCADTVDINSLEYEVVNKLAQSVRTDLLPEDTVPYWIPIYGYLYGGLTVRRNLRYEEYKKLQNTISFLEGEIRDNKNLEILIPKVINVYLWIFDYYLYQMKTHGGAVQIFRRVLELFALLYQIPGYEDSAKKLGLCAENVIDTLLHCMQNVD